MGNSGIAVRSYESGLDRILFIMGWGNDFDQPGVRWLVQKLNRDGYSVTVVRIPTDIRDYKRDIIAPVVALSKELHGPILISHSFGAVAGRYIMDSKKRIFSSPYWGVPKHRMFPLWKQILTGFQWMGPPIIDRGYPPSDLGDMIDDDDVNLIPRRISIRTIYQIWNAQKTMPDLREGDHVFYASSERISDLEAIRSASCRKTQYIGGHAFFSSSSREKTIHDILYDLRSVRSA
jgi:hypothetical protein